MLVIKIPTSGTWPGVAVYITVLTILFQLLKISLSRGLGGVCVSLQLTEERGESSLVLFCQWGPPQPVLEQQEHTERARCWEGNGCSQMRLTPRTGSGREAGADGVTHQGAARCTGPAATGINWAGGRAGAPTQPRLPKPPVGEQGAPLGSSLKCSAVLDLL